MSLKKYLGYLFGKRQGTQQTTSTSLFVEEFKKIRHLVREHNFEHTESIQAFIKQSLVKIQNASYQNLFPLRKEDITAWVIRESIDDSLRFVNNIIEQMNENSVPYFTIIATTDSRVSNKCNEALVASGCKPSEIACLLAQTTAEEKNKIKEKVILGTYRFLIADGYLLDSDFYLGDMENAILNIMQSMGAKRAFLK